MTLQTFRLIALSCTLALAGCAGTGVRNTPAAATPKPLAETAPALYNAPCATLPSTPARAFDCDRNSILAMAGEFRVRFAFDETASLAPAYAPHPAQRSGATEFVEVVEDKGNSIMLQHILVMKMDDDVRVIKHWRQDWHFEPTQRLRYRGNGRFETEAIDADSARGAWVQVVYEVDDAPRYSGIGRWQHSGSVDAWTSDPSLRPLPRREYTRRTDYQAIEAINRHTLTPGGWVHEQDNTKIAIDANGVQRAIARERGINSYARITDFDFTAGRVYLRKTGAYWADVRNAWQAGFARKPGFDLSPRPNGEPRIKELFAQAERVGNGETIARSEITEVLTRYGLPAANAAIAVH
ncbi:MAG: DUF6607 family protein [Dokdonella sp.]